MPAYVRLRACDVCVRLRVLLRVRACVCVCVPAMYVCARNVRVLVRLRACDACVWVLGACDVCACVDGQCRDPTKPLVMEEIITYRPGASYLWGATMGVLAATNLRRALRKCACT